MIIIPAIDIKNGKCVRLTQGIFAKEKIYSDDPIAVARQWEQQGAKTLHVVDLDGAKSGKKKNFEIIKKLTKAVSVPIQVGGGIRNYKTAKAFLSKGVAKITLGTVAVEDKELLKELLKKYGSQVIVALDTKNGKLVKNGWLENSKKDCIKTALELEKLGVKGFIYTDTIKDGTMTEPNYKDIKNLIKIISVPIIISGGISSLNQIKKLKKIGAEAIIIGKALYEKKINLKEAIKNAN